LNFFNEKMKKTKIPHLTKSDQKIVGGKKKHFQIVNLLFWELDGSFGSFSFFLFS